MHESALTGHGMGPFLYYGPIPVLIVIPSNARPSSLSRFYYPSPSAQFARWLNLPPQKGSAFKPKRGGGLPLFFNLQLFPPPAMR